MIEKKKFGTTKQGRPVNAYTFSSQAGMEVSILDYGAIIHSIKVPDKNGKLDEITLGYDTLDQYQSLNQFFGAFVGRFANRIRNGTFHLDGKEIGVSKNSNDNHIHGGFTGFDQKSWQADVFDTEEGKALCLELTSEDGDQGFPGRLQVKLIYELTRDNGLKLTYSATTDAPTIINLASHTYFNLSGDPNMSILNHQLQINADLITAIDQQCIPTGEFMDVAGTPFDFRSFYSIGERIDSDHTQMTYGGGYDHNYVLQKDSSKGLSHAATVIEPVSGRKMALFATQPGLQFYSGNSLEKTRGKQGKTIKRRHGFCLEAQHFPDSPNHEYFPSTRLDPGQEYHHQLVLRFSTINSRS
jgi:aldose 1-epimerase